MIRVICHTYPVAVFEGVEFREENVGGLKVGVAHVPRANRSALKWFDRRSQFTVEWGDAPPPPPPEVTTPTPDLAALTVAQLREYAAENGIDLGTATRKADILAAVTT